MTLDEVHNIRCECGKSYPPAHWIPQKINAQNFGPKPDRFKKHKNMRCACCIRKEIHDLSKVKEGEHMTREAKARVARLKKLLGTA